MKQLFSIVILCVIFAQTLSTLILFLNYEMNRDYISKTLCENRSKPRMHCNGKCYLKKQLDKEEKREQSPFNPIKEKMVLEFFFGKRLDFLLFSTSAEIEKNSLSQVLISDKHIFAVFHPPPQA